MSEDSVHLVVSPEMERLRLLRNFRLNLKAIAAPAAAGDVSRCEWNLRHLLCSAFGHKLPFAELASDVLHRLELGELPLADIDTLLAEVSRFTEKLERLGPLWAGDPPGPDDVYDARSPSGWLGEGPVLTGALSTAWCDVLHVAGQAQLADASTRNMLRQELFEHLRGRLPAEVSRFAVDSLDDTVRLEVLLCGNAQTRHRDEWRRVDERRATLLSMLVFLNEDFGGGELVLYNKDKAKVVVPRQGDVVIWEHCHEYESRPVEQGSRTVLRAEVVYRAPGRVGALGDEAIVAETGALEERPYYPEVLANNPKLLQARDEAWSRIRAI